LPGCKARTREVIRNYLEQKGAQQCYNLTWKRLVNRPLAPPRWLLKAKDPAMFDREYRKQLDALDAKQVAKELGPDAILLCWESFNVRCHRRLVAAWLEEKFGIVVPELGHDRTESVPFSEQPSKWDNKSNPEPTLF